MNTRSGHWGMRSWQRIAIVVAAMLLIQAWAACPPAWAGDLTRAYALTKGAPVADKPDAVPNQVLVKYKSGKEAAVMARLQGDKAVGVLKSSPLFGSEWKRLDVMAPKGIKEAIEVLRADPDVLYAEPNYYWRSIGNRVAQIPNDPRFAELWGMHNTGQNSGTVDADIDAPEAWSITTSSNILVAVIDTGIDRTHPDLAANMWVNLAELNGTPGVDDDGDGFIDDIYGWNFVNNTADPMDDNNHGSHCSGTIGGCGNNGVGVAGVCWNVKIMAVKFLDSGGSGSTDAAIQSVNYAVMKGAKVLSNSWGGGLYSQALKDAIDAANAAGCIFVAAAGNASNNNDANPSYPASYDCPNIIAVAATDQNDNLASYSSYGATTVDLAAPGGANDGNSAHNILSTTRNNTYSYFAGTSMATPHVSGACALVWGAAGGMTHMQIKDAILQSADPKPQLTGKCLTGARLNVANALAMVSGRYLRITAPNGGEGIESPAPTSIEWSATGTDWQAGDTVALAYSADGGATWIPISGAGALPYNAGAFLWDITGLALGSQYLVRVTYNADPTVTDGSDAAFAITGPLHHFLFAMATPQYSGRPVRSVCTVTAKDLSDRTITTFGTYNTAGRFPVTITAPGVTISGLGAGGNSLVAGDFTAGQANLTARGMVVTVAAPPVTVAFTATAASGPTGISGSVTIEARRDYFTEIFTSADNDLRNISVYFIPDSSGNYYAGRTLKPLSALPTDPTGGTLVSLSDDSYVQVTLAGAQVHLYGQSYSSFYIGSNGYITFTSGDSTYSESTTAHFNQPRISGLFDDLNPGSAGQVSYKQLADRVAVTWLNVPQYGGSDSNTFQIEMHFDGKIVLSYLAVAATDGLAGLSAGGGLPADFEESDLSAYPPLGNMAPTAQDVSAETGVAMPVTIALHATDDGDPNPPGVLDYIIVSLPTNGALSDPAAGPIAAVPYTLAGHGNRVVFTSTPPYVGLDTFQYKANDSQYDSNNATVTVEVLSPPPAPFGPTPDDGANNVATTTRLWWNGSGRAYMEDFNDGQAQDWVEITDPQWNVVSGEYRAAAGTTGYMMQSTYTGRRWLDSTMQVDLRLTGEPYSAATLFFRASDDFNIVAFTGSAYVVAISGNGSYYVLKFVDGSYTFIQPWTSSPYLNMAPATNTIQAAVAGSTISVYFNGTLAWTGSDTSVASEGRFGLWMYSGSSAETVHYADNVRVADGASASPGTVSARQSTYNRNPVTGGSPWTAPATGRSAGDNQTTASPVNYDVYFAPAGQPLQMLGTTTSLNWVIPTLLPATAYHWQVIARNAGGAAPGPEWTFVTAPATIATLAPPNGPPGTQGLLTGANFGVNSGTVRFTTTGGSAFDWQVLSWSDTEIAFRASLNTPVGAGQVKVITATSESAGMPFTVTDPTTIYVNAANASRIENGSTSYPFNTIQEGINAATSGDTVIVAPATYVETINFIGKAITVQSTNPDDPAIVGATVIDANQQLCAVVFNHGEGRASVIQGFLIRNGFELRGAGVFCDGTSPTVQKNRIEGNLADFQGGGVACRGSASAALIYNNRIVGNNVQYTYGNATGGGIHCDGVGAGTIITGNIIAYNSVGSQPNSVGGGIRIWNCSPLIINNVIFRNEASVGGGIALYASSSAIYNNTVYGNRTGGIAGGTPSIANCILWNNGIELNLCTATYSCIEGGAAGTGNISADPLFADRANDDFSLTSSSPCIDGALASAAPSRDILGNARRDDPGILPNGGLPPDIGAYEFQGTSLGLEVIVDNTDSSPGRQFTAVPADAWEQSCLKPGFYGGDYRLVNTISGATADATATWTASIGSSACDVYAWWPASSAHSTYARYVVHHAGGTTTIFKSQAATGGQWVLLGTFTFGPGGHWVDVTNAASQPGRYVIADAIKFVLVPGVNPPTTSTSTTITTSTVTTSLSTTTSTSTTNTTRAPTTSTTTTTLPSLIIDNADTAVEKNWQSVLGTWSLGTSLTDKWAANYRTCNSTTNAGATCRSRFSTTLLDAGSYEVFAWWAQYSTRSTTVPFVIKDGTTELATVRVNQVINGGRWNSLGTYTFSAGGHNVEVHNGATGTGLSVCADAIKFEPRASGPTTTVITTSTTTITVQTTTTTQPGLTESIVDNTDNTVVKKFEVLRGTWSSGSSLPKYGADYRYAASSTGGETARARWSCTNLQAGTYEVRVYWQQHTNRSTVVPYIIKDGATELATVTANQQNSAGTPSDPATWYLLGTFSFGAGGHVVEVSNLSTGSSLNVGADAVRFVKVGP